MQVNTHARQNRQANGRLVFQGAAIVLAFDTHQHAVLERGATHRVRLGLGEQQRFGKRLAGRMTSTRCS